jgi:hypothetical protein
VCVCVCVCVLYDLQVCVQGSEEFWLCQQVNYFGGGLELLDDAAAHVLIQVGLLHLCGTRQFVDHSAFI